MKNIFRIKYIVEFVVALVCMVVSAITLSKYGANVPVQVGDEIVPIVLIGIVCTVLAIIDMYIYEQADLTDM